MNIETGKLTIAPEDLATQTFLTPLLSQKILDCVNFNENQIIYTKGQNVTINNDNNIAYPDNAAICITDVKLSYDCLGLTLPVSFLLCGMMNTFEIDDGGCDCITIVNTIPGNIQQLINTTITNANSAIGVAQNVFSSTSIAKKTQNAYNAALIASQTALNAGQTITALFNLSYPTTSTNTVQRALLYLNQGINSLAIAQTAAAQYVNNQTLLATNAGTITTSLTNALTESGLAAGEILTITSPAPPASATTAANNALNQVTNAQTLINNFTTNPNWNTLSIAIDNIYLVGKYAQTAVYNTASASGTEPAAEYTNSLGSILYAIFLAQSADDALFKSYSATGSEQIGILDTSAYDSITSANYSKQSANYQNTAIEQDFNFYNNFKTDISSCICSNTSCCSCPCINTDKSLFLQPLYAFQACNLKIYVYGTIGGLPFTGTIDYPDVTPLSELNFTPINLTAFLSLQNHSSCGLITLKENLNPCFALQCIYPSGTLQAGGLSTSFPVDLFFNFSLTGNLTVTKRSPIPVLSSNTPINCS